MQSLLTRQEIERELGRGFAPEQASILMKAVAPLHQMERERTADTYELKQGLAALAAAQARTEQRVEELAAAQARTEQRVEELAAAQARTEQRVEELAAAQARTEQRVERLEATVERLIEAQARTEERLQRLEAVVEKLVVTMAYLEVRVADLTGWQLEYRYQQRAMAYFGRLLRRVRVLSLQELEETLEPRLSEEEWEDLLELDLLVSGQPRHRPEVPPVWLAVEVSATVDQHDVERAQRRAAALRRAGYRTIPTVAGKEVADEAEEAIRAGHLLVVQDGRTQFWEEALAAALAE